MNSEGPRKTTSKGRKIWDNQLWRCLVIALQGINHVLLNLIDLKVLLKVINGNINVEIWSKKESMMKTMVDTVKISIANGGSNLNTLAMIIFN